MRIVYLFILLQISLVAIAQDTAKVIDPVSKPPRLFIGVNVSAGAAFRTIHGTEGSAIEKAVVNMDNDLDRVKPGYGVGIDVTYFFKKGIGFRSGLYYMNKGWQSKWTGAIDTSHLYSSPVYSFKNGYNYHFASIPVMIAGNFGKGKVKFVCSVGMMLDILVATETVSFMATTYRYERNTYHWVNASLYNVVSMSANVSAGISYAINRKMGVKIEPSFNHQFIPLYAEGSVKHYLWNAGLNVAYFFGLK